MMDLEAWVETEEEPARRLLRTAMQLVLRAIALHPRLSAVMIMKGGVLMAVRYQSERFTTDIDFSTSARFQESDIQGFLADLGEALARVAADNEYALDLRVQSHQVQPAKRPDVTFPTLQIKVGFALRTNRNAMQRLAALRSPHTVQIDYSFNEWACDVEKQALDGGELALYRFHDLLAEKLRSVLQQSQRVRDRGQDIYDLFLLLTENPELTAEDRAIVLHKLREAARDREVPVHRAAMQDAEIIERSRKSYASKLPDMLPGPVPDFDLAYRTVRVFFESMPWEMD